MSKLYDNIRVVCKQNGFNIADLEKPYKAGYISRHERRDAIMELPVGMVYNIAKECHVTVEELIENDIYLEAEIAKVRAELARLEAMEKELKAKQTDCSIVQLGDEHCEECGQTDCSWK